MMHDAPFALAVFMNEADPQSIMRSGDSDGFFHCERI
jgi:hypothetical protein